MGKNVIRKFRDYEDGLPLGLHSRFFPFMPKRGQQSDERCGRLCRKFPDNRHGGRRTTHESAGGDSVPAGHGTTSQCHLHETALVSARTANLP
jgi:hypothetical protein